LTDQPSLQAHQIAFSTLDFAPTVSVMIWQSNAVVFHETTAFVNLLRHETYSLFQNYWGFELDHRRCLEEE
jgi:hypothetical protein